MRHLSLWRVLFVLSALYFVERGPWRAVNDSGDFLIVYSGARCWLHRSNPYLPVELAASAHSAGADVGPEYFTEHPSLYPPPALAILSPLALLPWTSAKLVWIALIFALSWWAIVAFAEMGKEWALPLACFLFIFAHLHTGISLGQPSVLVCGLIFVSLFVKQPYLAGLLLGLAVTLKPQLGIGFLALTAYQRQWRKLITSCLVVLIASSVGLGLAAPASLTDLMANIVQTSAPASPNSSSPLNPFRYELINITTLIPAALYQAPIVVGITAVLVVLSVIAIARTTDPKIAVALVASATVLVIYHHYYDSEILWLNIPAMLYLTNEPISRWLWSLYSVFLVPGQTMAARWFHLKDDNVISWVLLNHETLAIVLVWMSFVWIAMRQSAALEGSKPAKRPRFFTATAWTPLSESLVPRLLPSALFGRSPGALETELS